MSAALLKDYSRHEDKYHFVSHTHYKDATSGVGVTDAGASPPSRFELFKASIFTFRDFVLCHHGAFFAPGRHSTNLEASFPVGIHYL